VLRKSLLVVAILAVIVAVFVARIPASWLGERVAAAGGNAIRFVAGEGTLWSGRGALASADGRWRVPVAWKVAPLALLRGELAVTLVPEGEAAPRGTLRLTTSGATIEGLALRLPASAFESALGARVPLTLGGEIVIDAPEAGTAGMTPRGRMNLQWNGARIAIAGQPGVALGEVTGTLAARGDAFAGPVANIGGDVRIAGTVELAATRSAVDLALTPQPSAPPELARALAAFGTPAADGTVRLAWRGATR
jgi:hypothetical protein